MLKDLYRIWRFAFQISPTQIKMHTATILLCIPYFWDLFFIPTPPAEEPV